MAFNISKCREQIDEACNISLATDTMNDFDKCNDIMIDFRQDSYIKTFLLTRISSYAQGNGEYNENKLQPGLWQLVTPEI